MTDKLQEVELLYQNNEFSVDITGSLHNPLERPLRSIIYELASQLKHKEKECELLNTQLKSYHIGEPKLVAENENLNNQLQAEQQKVKELEEKYKWFDYYKESALYNKDLCNKKSDEIDKYKQALEEIKVIVSDNLCEGNCDDCPSNCECDWKDVTDKISEVLDE